MQFQQYFSIKYSQFLMRLRLFVSSIEVYSVFVSFTLFINIIVSPSLCIQCYYLVVLLFLFVRCVCAHNTSAPMCVCDRMLPFSTYSSTLYSYQLFEQQISMKLDVFRSTLSFQSFEFLVFRLQIWINRKVIFDSFFIIATNNFKSIWISTFFIWKLTFKDKINESWKNRQTSNG